MKIFLRNAAVEVTCVALLFGSIDFTFGQSRPTNDKTEARVRELIDREYSSLDALYKHLHTHPEISLQEKETGKRITEELQRAGFEVKGNVGGNGVVGVLRNGAGPTVLVRTDLDALPVKEQTGLPYSSVAQMKDEKGETVSVMHACGHDVHMTVFTGTARVLASLKDRWQGTIVLLGQPAEERGKGARSMLSDGLFSRFPKPNFCLALHCSANLPAGTAGYVEGYAMANVDSVNLTIRGIGGHGAWPHATKDPIVLAAETILALQTIVSRETSPIEPAVVTVGSIHGGTKHNIIPDEVKLQLTLRSYSDDVRNHTIEAIKRITRGLAIAAGLPEDKMPIFTLEDEFTPATYNDPELTRRVSSAIKRWIGEDKVLSQKPVMGGEDFGEYGRTADKIPICLFWLGAVAPDLYKESQEHGKALPSLHSAQFRPLPEPTIKTGITAMTSAVLELIGKKTSE